MFVPKLVGVQRLLCGNFVAFAMIVVSTSSGLSQTSPKFVRQQDYDKVGGSAPNNPLEVDLKLKSPYKVIKGLGIRANPGNVTTMVLYARRLDPQTGSLGELEAFKAGSSPDHPKEVEILPEDVSGSENAILYGLGLRANPGNITTLILYTKNITAEGTLADQQVVRGGSAEHNPEEVHLILPDPYVVVGVALRAEGRIPTDRANITTIKGYFGRLVPSQ